MDIVTHCDVGPWLQKLVVPEKEEAGIYTYSYKVAKVTCSTHLINGHSDSWIVFVATHTCGGRLGLHQCMC